jgi:hypothetical protein
MAMTLLALPSCKSLDPTTVDTHHSSLIAHHSTDTNHSSLIAYNSLHDSVIYRERTIHDTVYITKEIYRDTHHSSLIAHNSTKADTVVRTDTIVQVIEHPPERYIPPFYKHCTTILFIILAAGIAYLVIRCRLLL